jgi:hypothetical protein
MTDSRVRIALWAWATIAILGAGVAELVPNTHVAPRRATFRWDADTSDRDTLYAQRLENVIIQQDPFGIEGLSDPAPLPYLPNELRSPVIAPNSVMRITAIVGPPWRAVIGSVGVQSEQQTVEVGDTLRGSRIVRISADSVVFRSGSSVLRRAIGESWQP